MWVIISVCIYLNFDSPKTLGELGDYFGGFFGPLFLLWVVIGYYQQGTELRYTAEILEGQQKASERVADANEEDILLRMAEFEPRFKVEARLWMEGKVEFEIENLGNYASEIEVKAYAKDLKTEITQTYLDFSQKTNIYMYSDKISSFGGEVDFQITCVDRIKRNHIFSAKRNNEGKFETVKIPSPSN